MQWENLTSSELKKAVKTTGGVCLLALGVIEKHSEHLPLGTDFLVGHKVCCLAAQKEPVVVFPPFYFGQIYEARCFPGAITLKPTLLLDLILGVFDEIGRNGFKKIILHNAHGGNTYLLNFLAQTALWEERPYSLFVQTDWLTQERRKKWNALLETKEHGHACECETSVALACFPGLVKRNKVPKKPARALKRLRHLFPFFSGIKWYADYPDHYAGDARYASKEKGEKLLRLLVDTLAEFIARVKADRTAEKLQKEFFRRVKDHDFKMK